ncbi:MAG: hypothetical protein AAF412_04925, partial [Pseudomonadota bacterium]
KTDFAARVRNKTCRKRLGHLSRPDESNLQLFAPQLTIIPDLTGWQWRMLETVKPISDTSFWKTARLPCVKG